MVTPAKVNYWLNTNDMEPDERVDLWAAITRIEQGIDKIFIHLYVKGYTIPEITERLLIEEDGYLYLLSILKGLAKDMNDDEEDTKNETAFGDEEHSTVR